MTNHTASRPPRQQENKKRRKILSLLEILRISAINPDIVRMAICPSCFKPMETVFCGRSGQECWCANDGCDIGFKYNADGDFDSIVRCPSGWTGDAE